jgi:hypothetical protein
VDGGELLETLKGLVRVASDRVPDEPRLHVKLLLAEHARDDAESVAALRAAGTPDGEPRAVLDIVQAYREVNPRLLRNLAGATSPELIKIRHDQERHLVEIPSPEPPPAIFAEPVDDELAAQLRALAQAADEALRG